MWDGMRLPNLTVVSHLSHLTVLTITVAEFSVTWNQTFLQIVWSALLIFAYTFEKEKLKERTREVRNSWTTLAKQSTAS